MHRMIATALLLAALGGAVAGAGAGAGGCADLGLRSDYLAAMFCAELESLAESGAASRGIGAGDTAGSDGPGLPDWPDIAVLQDAYRADPRKTLELIRRIKAAGGLSSD